MSFISGLDIYNIVFALKLAILCTIRVPFVYHLCTICVQRDGNTAEVIVYVVSKEIDANYLIKAVNFKYLSLYGRSVATTTTTTAVVVAAAAGVT